MLYNVYKLHDTSKVKKEKRDNVYSVPCDIYFAISKK